MEDQPSQKIKNSDAKVRRYKIAIALISFVLPTILYWYSSLPIFPIAPLLFGSLSAYYGFSKIEKINKQKQQNYAIGFAKFLLLFSVLIFIAGAFSMSCSSLMTPGGPRTNIITGECSFGGGSGCTTGPWYDDLLYRSGCNK
jgi:hypothetical protein